MSDGAGLNPVTIHTVDGYALRGHSFAPSSPIGITVVVNPAVFVRQRFYYAFARWLASQGVFALTYSNRGMGLSLAAQQGEWHNQLRHWGERDLPAVIAWAKEKRPSNLLFVVGHSMGGQLVALSDAVHELDGIVTFAATSAYWRHWPRPHRYGILGWYGIAPLIGRILPYFPANLVRFGPNVDSHIVRDWVRWGRHRDYLFGPFSMRPKMADYRGRVLAWSFADDRLGVRAAVDDLHRHYTSARLDRRHVSPRDIGQRHIGHFACLKQETGLALWQQTLAWMKTSGEK